MVKNLVLLLTDNTMALHYWQNVSAL